MMCFLRVSVLALGVSAGVVSAARPPLHTLVINASSNVAGGSALHVAVDRPEFGSLTTTGSVRMFSPSANQWTASIAVLGSTISTSVNFKLATRTTSSSTHCTLGNGNLSGPTLATNVPLWNPGYTGKTVYYHTSWTNAFVLFRVGQTETFSNAPMTRVGPGRAGGEFLYRIDGIGEAGRALEFVPNGYSAAGVLQWDNPALGGINNNYFTWLDTLFLQDGNIFNYFPPAAVSAPQVINVTTWNSSYTGNGIPSRGGRIYLPRGYTQNTAKKYPVLYMHDGQNVFDPGGAFGSWSADAAATREIGQGRMRETIIVAVNNSNNRMSEYGTPQDGFTGNFYLSYLVNNVRPNINATYRTLTNRMDTGVMGSSLGGLISAYCGLSTNVFGLIGAVSPSYWYGPNFRSWIDTQPTKGSRIYQDAGTAEGASMWDYFWPVLGYYQQDGYIVNDDVLYAIGCDQGHNEAAWANRVPGAFRFLLNPWDETNGLETNTAPSPGTIQFSSATIATTENSNSVRVLVGRLGGASGVAGVSYHTSNGTAVAGLDFTATSGTLNWTNNDATEKFFDVPLINNAVYEQVETFTVVLSAATGASLGSPSVATITINDNDPVPPGLSITNPPGSVSVSVTTTVVALQGQANPFVWSGLRWTNSLTGGAGLSAIDVSWMISGIALGEGDNVITVTATNLITEVTTNAADRADASAYGDGWSESDNGGFGFGGWSLYTSSTNVNNNGRFLATDASVDIGTPAWGLYANSGNLSEAKRILTNTLAIGQTLSVSMDNGFIDPGSGVGVAVQNVQGDTLWEFFFNGGDQVYTISGGTTDVGWTSTGIDVAFTLTGTSTYRAAITPRGSGTSIIEGNLNASTNTMAITRFRAWNYNAGSGSDYDVFFNHLSITTATASPNATNAAITITRPPALHDGIPMTWWNQYGLGTNQTAAGDHDNDGASNAEEYIADTHPGQAASVFTNRVVLADGPAITIQAGPPTTNSRVYELWYSTNLTGGAWLPFGSTITGAANGGALWWPATNSADVRYYRSGVRLP